MWSGFRLQLASLKIKRCHTNNFLYLRFFLITCSFLLFFPGRLALLFFASFFPAGCGVSFSIIKKQTYSFYLLKRRLVTLHTERVSMSTFSVILLPTALLASASGKLLQLVLLLLVSTLLRPLEKEIRQGRKNKSFLVWWW